MRKTNLFLYPPASPLNKPIRVEGDSASSAELYAIISSLAGLPINQGIAVTGSVNQNGEIQPIGGVNQKISGFSGFVPLKA